MSSIYNVTKSFIQQPDVAGNVRKIDSRFSYSFILFPSYFLAICRAIKVYFNSIVLVTFLMIVNLFVKLVTGRLAKANRREKIKT